jgi:peptidoglycan hydrolase-like protein with peptidoglycan-binding domain
MWKGLIAGLVLSAAAVQAAGAQEAEQVWLQVEALPTLGRAQDRVAAYADTLADVQGYYLGSGWYGVVLGPYSRAEAEAVRRQLLAEGIIPGDAFLADGSSFRQQFYPLAAQAEAEAAPPANPAADPVSDSVAETVAEAPAPAIPDETPEEARASEAALTQGEKELLQIALQWAGVYAGGIDGAFGRGTRAAMAAWQQANGHEPTGILTARERAALLAAYNAPLAGLGMETVRDAATGIEVALPLGVLEPPAYDPPFARFEPRRDTGAEAAIRVVLISQPGDAGRLAGLYEIMQTLEIVPPEGPRQRTADAFAIEGIDARLHSTTYAWLVEGEIKGFTLVWPTGDEERRSRVLDLMRASFRRLPGTLDAGAGTAGEDQAVDLVSGLQLRRPERTASGFFVDGGGTVVTTAAAVEGCREVTIDGAVPARVAALRADLGLAVLAPEAPLAPRSVAAFQTAVPRIASDVAVAGFPYGGALAQPALTFGTLADIRGLNGEEEVKRLALSAQPGDAGGPVLDAGGAVLGMLLPAPEGAQVLPADVRYALETDAILAALAQAGIRPATTAALAPVTPERLTREAAGLAVLVSCW